MTTKGHPRRLQPALRWAAGLSALGAAGWLAHTARRVPHDLPLAPALAGELRDHRGRSGRVAVYVAGEGPPLILVHSVNAAASAFELRTVFEHARRTRRVYAPDLPGFGQSDRSARRYDIALYVHAVDDLLDLVAADCGSVPVDALALSLGCEFAARAALARPERFRSLSLVAPTGLARLAKPVAIGEAGASRELPGLRRVLDGPIWGQPLYDLLVSRRSIRYFLRRTCGTSAVDEGLVDYCYATAHRPGARHAPYAFLSGALFGRDIRAVYERLSLPVWMPHATRGDFRQPPEALGALRDRTNWRIEPMPTGALPQFEAPERFLRAFDDFLASI